MRMSVILTLLVGAGVACSPDGEVDSPDTEDVVIEPEVYDCGWPKNDPGTLNAGDGQVGTIVGELIGPDQCGEMYSIWDGHGEYMMVVSPPMW